MRAALNGTYTTVGFVLEDLRWDGQHFWIRFSYDLLHEFLVVDAVRSSNVDLFVVDVFRVENPSNVILLYFDLHKKCAHRPHTIKKRSSR